MRGGELELPVAVGAFAGLRREEICRLNWGDLDLATGFLTVLESKSDRFRSIPIHHRLAAILKRHRRCSGAVCRNGGSRWTLDALSHRIRDLGKSIGLAKLSGPHVLRHTFGSLLAAAGASAHEIKGYMGHSSLIVTERYMHLTPGRRGKIDEI